GTLHMNTTYSCPGGLWYGGREYHCWRHQGHGTLSVHRAIVQSCDVFFYEVGEHLGVDKIARWANLLGLGLKSGIDLDNEKPGLIPSSEWKQKKFHERWYPAETLSVAIGQGYVAATPLQMAQLAAMVANGGIRYKPQFVKMVEGLNGSVSKAYPPTVESRVNIDPAILQEVRDAMADVVNSPGGTAHKAQLPGIIVCGKTGTAQIVGEKADRLKSEEDSEDFKDNAWFIAFAPEDHPQIAIACIIEHGGHGGSAAAPVVHDVLKRFFELNPPPPRPEISRVLDNSQPVAER
ncbi:MAG TPA: penicillin-binding transpeptidase domain-containing protein, partial [Candidatus Binataceae bacterium]